jgi:hypothetical protein
MAVPFVVLSGVRRCRIAIIGDVMNRFDRYGHIRQLWGVVRPLFLFARFIDLAIAIPLQCDPAWGQIPVEVTSMTEGTSTLRSVERVTDNS